MKIIKKILYFLSSVYLALLLIICAALTVIAGTLLESHTGSHQLAAQWTYEHPLFLILLSLFFVNILFSALRRWPFRKNHIPFLITHLGLLMMIGGTMAKNRYGLQGHLSVWEGSASQEVLLPYTYALYIEKNENNSRENRHTFLPLSTLHRTTYFPSNFPFLKCKIIGFAPHVTPALKTWIKDSKLCLKGVPPIKVEKWTSKDPFPIGLIVPLSQKSAVKWRVSALNTKNIKEALKASYLQDLILKITDKRDSKNILEISLKEALLKPLFFADNHWQFNLDLTHHPQEGFLTASLSCRIKKQGATKTEFFTVSLKNENALYLNSESKWKSPFFTLDLKRSRPSLCFIENITGELSLFAFDCHGRVHEESFDPTHMRNLFSFDSGFGGYALQAIIPVPPFDSGRQEKERAEAWELTNQFKEALAQATSLSPPLTCLKKACLKTQEDFAEIFICFLSEWHNCGEPFLFKKAPSDRIQRVLNAIEWEKITDLDSQGMKWTAQLFDVLEESSDEGEDSLSILSNRKWPLTDKLKEALEKDEQASPSNLLAQQIFSLVSYLPLIEEPSPPLEPQQSAKLLSTFFRGYGIDYPSLMTCFNQQQEELNLLEKYQAFSSKNKKIDKEILIETAVNLLVTPSKIPLKVEDRIPGIVLEVEQGDIKEKIALPYDQNGTDLKWPILRGAYALRFQPKVEKLPYRIRLRQARQIIYPQSPQTYSYESDILITENEHPPIAETLSMNRVYETWTGYRFYLSGINKSGHSGIKKIQLVINHDPFKYFITYPGILLVFIGTILLFWFRRAKK